MISTVAIVRCETYQDTEVRSAVRRGIDLLGGTNAFFRTGERICLKPNALWASDPARCVVTHPIVFKAIAELLQECGTTPVFGDSPGGIGPAYYTLHRCGFVRVAKELGIELADFDHGRTVRCPSGISSKQLFIANGALDADGMISVPKLKTHGLTRLTCAIKNQFGCVPGLVKGEYHARFPDVYDFSALLADITLTVMPRLYVLDAVWAMEGNGPQSGDPRNLKCLVFSTDPVAMEAIACRIVNLDPTFVPTINAGRLAGLGTAEASQIQLYGDPLQEFVETHFKVRRSRPVVMRAGRFLSVVRRLCTRRPVITRSRCTRCGTCIKVCPVDPKALMWRGREPSKQKAPPCYNYRRCIRCFCCHEMCPEGAISIKRPLLGRLLPALAYLSLLVARIHSSRKPKKHY